LQKLLEFIEVWRSRNAKHVIHGHGASLQLCKHDLQNVEQSVEFTALARDGFALLNKRNSEVAHVFNG